ncbi:STAS domain-containing protein [Actinoplanes sp. L3-i22]|uniref:STAS domain-containing protein n=1 Tax=Actinoplanes sp. L3-i22 TaxID=2836373 RepID=UPI001C85E637|nr:STAS domain-containing protein [Actinoplanes sp. L3-i22]
MTVENGYEADECRIVVHTMTGMCLIRLVGDVDLAVAARLRATLAAAVAEQPWIIVDLSRVGAIDSVALGVLAAAGQAARRGPGGLLLAAAPPFVTEVLRAARLSTVFTMFATVPAAMTTVLAQPAPL